MKSTMQKISIRKHCAITFCILLISRHSRIKAEETLGMYQYFFQPIMKVAEYKKRLLVTCTRPLVSLEIPAIVKALKLTVQEIFYSDLENLTLQSGSYRLPSSFRRRETQRCFAASTLIPSLSRPGQPKKCFIIFNLIGFI